MQCSSKASSGGYNNCTGFQTSSYAPLQYQRPPFRDATILDSSSPTFKASRLYGSPEIKPCHVKYAGVYLINVNISNSKIVLAAATITLYQNGLIFTSPNNEDYTGNAIGVWNCDQAGTITYSFVSFRNPLPTVNLIRIRTTNIQLKCDGTANALCHGTGKDAAYRLSLPVNGQFQTKLIDNDTGILIVRKLTLKQ
ncbi:unnamed protein product [Didymodactylos carnosus]|uniref:Uncharacterized protein n=1 Tax=Didymodactylos carnosus TaxID=1234261 RepID=A0A814S7R1_9BILA|nr:unnamed protein product [Didymodactylos carnosus]CAF1142674.1 unnamed protein product [Didymodactylos carnosus]CAF3906320.1 unnamed protein product [Didymodactylos carnosus]CAF3936327.1 unnamed protein product [Didymodactylos carnosus]